MLDNAERKNKFVEISTEFLSLLQNAKQIEKSKDLKFNTLYFVDNRGRAVHLLSAGAKKREVKQRIKEGRK